MKHRLTKHRLYKTWNGMLRRCNSSNHIHYEYYGARGIVVCDRWLDVQNFIDDMYPSYIEGLTLDRIDNNKGYYKENCRWATNELQHRNTRALRKTNTTGFRGVSFDKNRNKFQAKITVNKKGKHLGYFTTNMEAAEAYDAYVIEHRLEHTRNKNSSIYNRKVTDKNMLQQLSNGS